MRTGERFRAIPVAVVLGLASSFAVVACGGGPETVTDDVPVTEEEVVTEKKVKTETVPEVETDVQTEVETEDDGGPGASAGDDCPPGEVLSSPGNKCRPGDPADFGK